GHDQKFLHLKWLPQIFERALLGCLNGTSGGSKRRHQHYREPWFRRMHLPDYLQAIGSRNPQVSYHDVECLGLRAPKAFVTAMRYSHLVTLRLQQSSQRTRLTLIVFNEQDGGLFHERAEELF